MLKLGLRDSAAGIGPTIQSRRLLPESLRRVTSHACVRCRFSVPGGRLFCRGGSGSLISFRGAAVAFRAGLGIRCRRRCESWRQGMWAQPEKQQRFCFWKACWREPILFLELTHSVAGRGVPLAAGLIVIDAGFDQSFLNFPHPVRLDADLRVAASCLRAAASVIHSMSFFLLFCAQRQTRDK